VQALRRLCRDAAARRADGVVVVEGRVLAAEVVERAAQSGSTVRVQAVYADPERSEAAAVARGAEALGASWYPVASDVLDKVADAVTSQGVVLVVDRPRWELASVRADGLVLLADEVSDPGNLGTLLRTAMAVGAAAVVTLGGSDPFSPKCVRAARGAQLVVPTLEVASEDEALDVARSGGRPLVVAAAGASTSMWDADLPGAVAVVVGNEAAGVRPALRAVADLEVDVPMPGGTESLNAAVTGSLLAYEHLRRHSL
jgi:TrmH family RNA methyltransferase